MRKILQRGCLCLSVLCVALAGLMWGASTQIPAGFATAAQTPVELTGVWSVVTIQAETNGEAAVQASSAASGGYTASAKLFGLFPFKKVAVEVADSTEVVLGGMPFGIKMYTDGVLVVGMADVDTATGAYNPARTAGIKTGDVILCVDGAPVTTNEQVAALVEESGGKAMTFRVRRDNIEFDIRFYPARYRVDNTWKAGLWVRDSSAGIGTLTFYDPQTNAFGGLGHAVCDVDTGEVLPLAGGEIVPVDIYSVVKGESGDPGELRGGFAQGCLGNLLVNGETGVYGVMDTPAITGEVLPVAFKQQIKTGVARVYTTIDGCEPAWYDITIEQVRYTDASPSWNMIIRITDETLLKATGGIVQGMSGSPIVQEGRLVGAVTHVYVNDPTKGYAIFAENMLNTARSVAAEELDKAS